jgi:molybdopterin-guanine dinucleotide biosynthesis protein A
VTGWPGAPREDLTGAILAGGRSRRMGRPKALLPVGGVPMVARVARALGRVCRHVLAVSDDPAPLAFLGVPVIPDAFPGRGPLGGLQAALAAATTPYVAVAACDMPFLNPAVVAYLAGKAVGWDGAVPAGVGPAGSMGYEPLCAVYARGCLGAVEARLRAGDGRMTSFFPDVRLRPVPREELERVDPGLRSFWNANTPEEYEAALRSAAGEEAGPAGEPPPAGGGEGA